MTLKDDNSLTLTRARAFHDAIVTSLAAGFITNEKDVLPLIQECGVLFREAEIDDLTADQLDAVMFHVTALELLVRRVGALVAQYESILRPEFSGDPR